MLMLMLNKELQQNSTSFPFDSAELLSKLLIKVSAICFVFQVGPDQVHDEKSKTETVV